MQRGKLTYAELLKERNHLEDRLKELQRGLKEADRHPVTYQAMTWISIPLKPAQKNLVREYFEDKLFHDDYKTGADGDRHYEEIHESNILPEFNYYLIRYTTDAEGEQTSSTQVWGLIPY